MTKLDAASGGWIVAAALVINTSAQAFLFAVLPTVGRTIGLEEWQSGAVLGIGALLGMFAAPAWGFASERWGRRPVLLATMVGVMLSPLVWAITLGTVSGIAPLVVTFIALILARCLQAGFGAGLIPTAQAYFADVTSTGRRAAGMGIMSASISLGTVAGSALIWAVAGFGALTGFIILAALASCALLTAVVLLPEPPRAPAVEPNAHRIPFGSVWPFLLVTMLGMTAYGMIQPITSLRLIDQFGLDHAAAMGQAGALLTGTALAMLFSQSVLAVRLGWPPQRLLVVGAAIGIVGTLLLATAGNLWIMAIAMAIVGGAVGLLLPGNLAAMSLATGSHAQGKVAGLNAVAMGLGLVIGPMAGTAIYNSAPITPYWTACALLVVLGGMVAIAGRSRSSAAPHAVAPAE